MTRVAWLQQQLQTVDASCPSEASNKHSKMAISPFYFFRGSAGVYYADLAEGVITLPEALLTLPLTTVMGDCHISNFGFFSEEGAHGETLIFAPNDFDDACMGHAVWDLLRFLVSLPLAQQEGVRLKQLAINDQSPERDKAIVSAEQVKAAMKAFLTAYIAYNQNSLTGHITSQSALLAFSEKHILYKRWQKGLQRLSSGVAFLTKSTLAKEVDCSQLPLRFKEDETRFVRLPENERQALCHHFAPYLQDEILDCVERIDAGTGSNNMRRYYLLVGPQDMTLNDLPLCYLVEIKQQRVAAPLAYFADVHPSNRLNAAHLTVHCQRRMQRRPDLILDDALWQGEHYLIRSRHHARVGIDPEHITFGKRAASKDGFSQYAQACGEALALAHMRGDRRSLLFQRAAVDTLPQHIDVLVETALNYTEQVISDHQSLCQLLGDRQN
ncbi:DUF2252 family protein [Pseudoalteromonas fenneropenaei]|uniref:DUF2252 family protein n=1 Tax=Pseudoalteromonas fenneropenaei TaxID=1737459 RepID=A0ABV7CMG1_9GAMM